MELTENLLRQLNKYGLTLDEYFVLYDQYFTLGMRRVYRVEDHTYEGLKGKGFISEKTGIILSDGREMLEDIWAEAGSKNNVKNYEEDFEKFWKAYPRTDKFKHFPATRNIRGSRTKTKTKLISILKEGKYDIHDILRALDADIKRMKTTSIKENRFSYMKSPYNWLNDEIYLNYIENLDSDPDIAKQRIIGYGKSIT